MDHQTTKRDRILKNALECRVDLVAYARALLGDHSAAEDAVQEAMLVVVRKFDQFREGTSILAWCRSIVRLEILRMKQARQRERSLAERLLDDAIDAAFDETTARSQDESENWRAALEHCLGQLTQRTQRLLQARCVEGLSYPQIGARLGMALEAVRKALFRSKKQIRDCVQSNLNQMA